MLQPRRQTIYPADTLTNPMSFIINYQQELNPAQYEAATTLDGPLLVVAGAGSGKTRTIVYRLARLIEEGVPPQQILLLTFTRKAAGRLPLCAPLQELHEDLSEQDASAHRAQRHPLYLLLAAAEGCI